MGTRYSQGTSQSFFLLLITVCDNFISLILFAFEKNQRTRDDCGKLSAEAALIAIINADDVSAARSD